MKKALARLTDSVRWCLVLAVFGALAAPNSLHAATYFIDYAAGSNANNGTSQTTAWKCHPQMIGSGCGTKPTYAHVAGDRYIFKGGVTWPQAAFPLNITNSGSASGADYYGVDQSYFVGGAWTRPVFDLQHLEITVSGNFLGIPIYLNSVSNVTIDNIEIKNMAIPASAPYGAGSISTNTSSNITVQNCYIHDWTPLSTTADQDNGGIFFGEGGNDVADHNTVGPGNPPAGQSGSSGVCIRSGSIVTNNDLTHCSDMYIGGATLIAGNTFHDSANSFQQNPVFHPNAIWHALGSGQTVLIHNNVIHDLDTQYQSMLLHPAWNFATNTNYYVYDNVLWNAGSPIDIDEYNATASCNCNAFVYSNTYQSGGGLSLSIVDRNQTTHLTLVDGEDNHWITDIFTGNGFCYQAFSCGTANSIIDKFNITMSTSVATSQGYTTANLYAPTQGSNSTVGVGTNLSAKCGAAPGLCNDIRGVGRPTGTNWDVGAYQSAALPNPPTNLTVVVR